jgi:hypothetical protein
MELCDGGKQRERLYLGPVVIAPRDDHRPSDGQPIPGAETPRQSVRQPLSAARAGMVRNGLGCRLDNRTSGKPQMMRKPQTR